MLKACRVYSWPCNLLCRVCYTVGSPNSADSLYTNLLAIDGTMLCNEPTKTACNITPSLMMKYITVYWVRMFLLSWTMPTTPTFTWTLLLICWSLTDSKLGKHWLTFFSVYNFCLGRCWTYTPFQHWMQNACLKLSYVYNRRPVGISFSQIILVSILHSELHGQLYTLQLCNNWHISEFFFVILAIWHVLFDQSANHLQPANWPNWYLDVKWGYLYHFPLYVFIMFIGCTC